tara:strand:+ start:25913 stop:26716 length:804 start_codon:yes stop_codon:yes gene_type:complete
LPTDLSITVLEQKGLLSISLNKPKKRNALDKAMIEGLSNALDKGQSPSVRCVLITGQDGAFCAGADLNEFYQLFDEEPDVLAAHIYDVANLLHNNVIEKIFGLNKPVIAGINGIAAGAGMSLSLACDMRICSQSSRFVMAYSQIGCTADGGSTYFLPKLVGLAKAKELYLMNSPISAEYAQSIGLVNQVVPDSSFDRHSLELGLRLAESATNAIGSTKALFNQDFNNELHDHLRREANVISQVSRTKDFRNGVQSFIEKKKPWFQGN